MGKKSKSAKTLDLHGYKVDEVFDAIDKFLLNESRTGRPHCRIMTGKGTGAVKKETLSYLKKAGYHWKYEELPNGKENLGVLIIFMD